MRTEIWVNLCGEWVELSTTDKVKGNLAYNWLKSVQLQDIEDEYLGVKHENWEYLIHKSCFQLRFINDN